LRFNLFRFQAGRSGDAMKTAAVILLALAALFAVGAVKNVFLDGANLPRDSAVRSGFVMGSFLPALACLIIGLVLWKKAPGRGESATPAAALAPPPGTAAAWHYRVGDLEAGPVAWEELAASARSGNLKPSDLVWTEGMPAWQPAASVAGLFPAPDPAALAAGVDPADAASPAADGDNASMRLLVPVGRSGWAIAAGYLGLISVLIFPAPFALATGIYAIIDIRRNPKKHGMGRAIFGVVMGGLGTLFLLFMLVGFLFWAIWAGR
jgi:hypothetical protein